MLPPSAGPLNIIPVVLRLVGIARFWIVESPLEDDDSTLP